MLKNLIRGSVAALVVVSGLVSSAFAGGFDVNATITGLALRGVDPVSYFTNGAPQDGDFSITEVHNGATYRFVSEENRDLFKQNPEKYLPAYGGFCAFGTAMDLDPAGCLFCDNGVQFSERQHLKEFLKGLRLPNVMEILGIGFELHNTLKVPNPGIFEVNEHFP